MAFADTLTMNAQSQKGPPRPWRWWAAVVAGAIVSLPLGWLLSYGAALVALLGLFFFALFGLVIGAVMYRVGAPARPVSSGRLIGGIVLVVVVCWGLAMWKEVRDFPGDKAAYALRKVAQLPEGVSAEQFVSNVDRFVRRTLTEEYGGSGFLGYARWVIASSRMEYHVETRKEPIEFKAVQYRGWWIVRVILSIGLLTFGIHAQVAPLERATDDQTGLDALDVAGRSYPTSEPPGDKASERDVRNQ